MSITFAHVQSRKNEEACLIGKKLMSAGSAIMQAKISRSDRCLKYAKPGIAPHGKLMLLLLLFLILFYCCWSLPVHRFIIRFCSFFSLSGAEVVAIRTIGEVFDVAFGPLQKNSRGQMQSRWVSTIQLVDDVDCDGWCCE